MAKERERREKTVAKAQAALDGAKAEHDATTRAIEAERAALDKRAGRGGPLGEAQGKARGRPAPSAGL